jgi:hypothetical protein
MDGVMSLYFYHTPLTIVIRIPSAQLTTGETPVPRKTAESRVFE